MPLLHFVAFKLKAPLSDEEKAEEEKLLAAYLAAVNGAEGASVSKHAGAGEFSNGYDTVFVIEADSKEAFAAAYAHPDVDAFKAFNIAHQDVIAWDIEK